jgi:hypothetical protein
MALPYSVFDEVNRLVIGEIIELKYTDLHDVNRDSRDFMCMFPEQLQDLKVNVSKRSSFGRTFRKDRKTPALLSTKPYDSTEEKLVAEDSEYVPLLKNFHNAR